MARKSYLITFEGMEGSGKSTHIRYAAAYLRRRGFKVLLLREPGSTVIGEKIRRILLDPEHGQMHVSAELFLYLAARAQLVNEMIRPALKKGWIVICDRFEDSTLVYQSAGGFNRSKLGSIMREARGSVVPDLTFLLDVDPRVGLRRNDRKDRMERKSISFHRRVRRGYLTLAKRNPGRIKIISTHGLVKDVRRHIIKALERCL